MNVNCMYACGKTYYLFNKHIAFAEIKKRMKLSYTLRVFFSRWKAEFLVSFKSVHENHIFLIVIEHTIYDDVDFCIHIFFFIPIDNAMRSFNALCNRDLSYAQNDSYFSSFKCVLSFTLIATIGKYNKLFFILIPCWMNRNLITNTKMKAHSRLSLGFEPARINHY